MKTTVEIPDSLFRQAAARRVKPGEPPANRPWMKAFGGLRELRRESRRLDRIIADEFGRIERPLGLRERR